MKRKEGVDVNNMHPAIWPDLFKLDEAVEKQYGYGITITSGRDGKHSVVHSDHYWGGAIDLRTWTTPTSGIQLKGQARIDFVMLIKRTLGADWYVENEHNHVHISYRPIYKRNS